MIERGKKMLSSAGMDKVIENFNDEVELLELLKEVLYAERKREMYNIMSIKLPIATLSKIRSTVNRIDPEWRRTGKAHIYKLASE